MIRISFLSAGCHGASPARALAVVCTLVATSLLAGCGGSSGLSHGELVAHANADCEQAVRSAARLGSPGASYAALNRYSRQLSPIVKQLIGSLGSLSTQASEPEALERYIAALRTGSHGLELLAGANTDTQATQAVSLIDSRPVASLARSLGASACATTPQP
jgi:hypothetical protein